MSYTVETVEAVPQHLLRNGKWMELRKQLESMLATGKPIRVKLNTGYELDCARATVYNWSNGRRLWGRVHTTQEGVTTLYIYIDPPKNTTR